MIASYTYYHGTPCSVYNLILTEGLKPGFGGMVFLSESAEHALSWCNLLSIGNPAFHNGPKTAEGESIVTILKITLDEPLSPLYDGLGSLWWSNYAHNGPIDASRIEVQSHHALPKTLPAPFTL